jgi:hypothetical protein
LFRIPFAPAVIALALVIISGCAGAPAPTPQIVYVTPVPTAVAVAVAVIASPVLAMATPTVLTTPAPTLAPTPKPTPKPTPVPTPKPITYATLSDRSWAKVVKAPDNYIGTGYALWGCISQFDAATGLDTFRAETSNKKREYWFSDGVNAFFSGDASRLADFVQDDVVYMKVLSMGSFSYDTQNGGNTTVPLFEIVSISRKGSCA